MSAQPDGTLEPTDLLPLRAALWRIQVDRSARFAIPEVAERIADEVNRCGGDYDPLKAEHLINAVTATRGPLVSLPRWMAEALAAALEIDPSDLRPEGSPAPLRPVPTQEVQPCRTLHVDRRGRGWPRKVVAMVEKRPFSYRYPCRKQDCPGGSNKSPWGRDNHERKAHGELYGPQGSIPRGMVYTSPMPANIVCEWCRRTLLTGREYIDHVKANHWPHCQGVPLDYILEQVSVCWQVPVETILSATMRKRPTEARTAAMYLARTLTQIPLPRLVQRFNRNEVAVTRSLHRVSAAKELGEPLGVKVITLEAKIRGAHKVSASLARKRSVVFGSTVRLADEPEWEWPSPANERVK